MSNWQQKLFQSESIEHQHRIALDKPFGMYVTSVAGDTESAIFRYYGNPARTVQITHPYAGPNSWIRALPEEAAAYVGVFRADEGVPQPVSSFQRNVSKKLESYRASQNLYRSLQPGEVEIASVGGGQSFYAKRPYASTNAGAVKIWSDQDGLSCGAQAPIHTKKLLGYASDDIQDEYRLGVVTRPTNTWEYAFAKSGGNFLAEEYLQMKNPAGSDPEILFSSHKGQLVNKTGQKILHASTQIPLRYQEIFYANDDSSTSFEIDEKGNYLVTLADAATEGYEMQIPTGNYLLSVARDQTVEVLGNRQDSVQLSSVHKVGNSFKQTVGTGVSYEFLMDSQNRIISFKTGSGSIFSLDDSGRAALLKTAAGNLVNLDDSASKVTVKTAQGTIIELDPTKVVIKASAGVTVEAAQVDVKAGQIKLGNKASMSAVLGEKLAELFDKHTHPTAVGPSGPPLPPNTAALSNANPATAFTSAFVKVQSNV